MRYPVDLHVSQGLKTLAYGVLIPQGVHDVQHNQLVVLPSGLPFTILNTLQVMKEINGVVGCS